MKIAVNTRLLQVNKLEGIGWFTFEILRRMVVNHPEVEFHFIFDRKPSRVFAFGPNVTLHHIGPPTRHVLLFPLWFNVVLPIKLRRIKPDLFISPDAIGSLNVACKQIVVMHDLNFVYHPEWLPKAVARFYNKYSPLFADAADAIVTVSNYSANDIVKCYNVPQDKVHVVSNAVNSSFQKLPNDQITAIRKKVSMGNPYFVYVGSLHERKNIRNLLLAFNQFAKAHPDFRMILVGAPLWNDKFLSEMVSELESKEKILFMGRLSGGELQEVVGAAHAMTFVPYFEGFGIPVLEAFACEVPLLSSNRTAIPEVAKDAALLVDPDDINEIAKGMKLLAENPDLCRDLVSKGRERVKDFSWDLSAERMWEVVVKTING